jgi:hypothetical protein
MGPAGTRCACCTLGDSASARNVASCVVNRRLGAQRGAVLATELKNNSNKLAKWTAQAILACASKPAIFER